MLPRWIYLPAAIGALFVVVPLIAIAAKVNWPNFWSLISSESSTTALVLSLKTSAASTALCLLLGVPMALVLARDGRSAVLITHDLLDVLTPADRVLVLETGQIVETGTTATFMAIPRSRFGARFAGLNLVGGTAHGDGVLTTQWGPDAVAGESAVALFNPSAVAV